MGAARYSLGSAGLQTAALAFGGSPGGVVTTEQYDGSSWTSTASTQDWKFITSSSDGTKLAATVSHGYIWTSASPPPPCTASDIPAKDGSDGSIYCINGGTVGGTTGSCTCTSCAARYGGKNCHIGPCDMEKACYDFNVRNGMTTPAGCAFLEDVTGCSS